MIYYGLYCLRTKREYTPYKWPTCLDWWRLITYIKKDNLESVLTHDTSRYSNYYWDTKALVVVTDIGLRVPYSEVYSSLLRISVKEDPPFYLDIPIPSKTTYKTLLFKYSYRNRYYPFKFRYDPVPNVSNGRWNKGTYCRYPKINKKYWAELAEYNVYPTKGCFLSTWYDEGDYRRTFKSWKHNSKKKKQWM